MKRAYPISEYGNGKASVGHEVLVSSEVTKSQNLAMERHGLEIMICPQDLCWTMVISREITQSQNKGMERPMLEIMICKSDLSRTMVISREAV